MKYFPSLLVAVHFLFSVPALTAAPANDAFESPHSLSGSLINIDDTLVDATIQGGENTSLDGSVWYTWTAPAKGLLSVGLNFPTTQIWRYVAIAQLNGTPSIFSLNFIANSGGYSQYPAVADVPVSAGVTYFIRVAGDRASALTPFSLQLAFNRTYSSAIAITTSGQYLAGRKRTLTGRVSNPDDVTNVRVSYGGAGVAKKVRYFPKSGVFTFEHHRRSVPPKGFFYTAVYKVEAMRGRQVIGSSTRTFRVIR